MTQPYNQRIIDLYKNPQNHGELADAHVSLEGTNPLCGDRVRVSLVLDGDVIATARFSANACAICVASASVLMQMVERAPLDDVESLGTDEIIRQLDATIPPGRLGCVSLPLTVMHSALQLHLRRQPSQS